MTDDISAESLPSPGPGSTYTTNGGVLSTAERRDDDEELYGIVLEGGVGMGGASLLDKRAVPWDQYVDLSDEDRELVVSNMNLVVKPPVEWGQYVMKHVQAFARQDRWAAGWLYEGAADQPDVEWEIEPYWSDEDAARYPKNIDDVYEKYADLDDEIVYERIRSGEVYLSNGRAVVYTQRSHAGRESATELKVGPMHATKVDPEAVSLLPFETALEMDDERLWELEQEDDDIWVQAEPSHTESFLDRMEAVYRVYAVPGADETRRMVERQYGGDAPDEDTGI